MTMLRVKARWSGFQGAPGYSIFHFRDFEQQGFTPADADNCIGRVRTLFTSVQSILPDIVRVEVEASCEVIDIESGQLTDIVQGGTTAPVAGTAGTGVQYAAPAGAVITWRSGTVRNGRRMRGRTFLVPLAVTAYSNDGTLAPTAITAINTGATQLRNGATGPDLVIFGRPPAEGVGAGTFGPVTGHSVPDMAAILSSRRD